MKTLKTLLEEIFWNERNENEVRTLETNHFQLKV